MGERNKPDVMEIKYLWSMCAVIMMGSRWSEEARRKVGVSKRISDRVDRKILKWFGHAACMSGEQFTKQDSIQ